MNQKKEYSNMEVNNMKDWTAHILLSGTIAASLILSGCKSEEDYKLDRIKKAEKQFSQIKKQTLPEDKVLSLQDCIDLAMKHNAEVRAQNIERDAAKNAMWAEILGMLPDLNITDSFTHRMNQPGSSSEAITSDGESYGYSYSQDKSINNLSVDAVFSLLDFGLAFFNSQQGSDRVLMKERQIQRMRQNLKLEVVRAYFKLSAAQRSIDIATRLLEQCNKQVKMIEKLRKSNQIEAFKAFEIMKKFLEMEKRLTNYTRVYEKSCVELRALLGVYPSASIIVDDTLLDKMPAMDLPDIEVLEQMAILKRPELYEIDIQKHINILECRKTILMMLPNVQLYADFVNNNNSFLYYKTWWELAVRAAYNALKTPQYLARYMAYSKQADIEELRSAALAITVMSQVRIAKSDIVSSLELFDINKENFKSYSKRLEEMEKRKSVRGDNPEIDLAYMRLITAESNIEKLLSLGACHIAYYRLLNSIGVDNLEPATQKALKTELADGVKRAKEELEKARAEYAAKQVAAENARVARLLFDEGIKYYKKNNTLAASEYFKRAAEKGDSAAMFCLGKLYLTGKGVKQDTQTAMACFEKAADAGNPQAMMTVAWIYYRNAVEADPRGVNPAGEFKFIFASKENYYKAIKYYEMAAEYYKQLKNEADKDTQRDMAIYRECKARYWLAKSYYDIKDYNNAMTQFKNAAYPPTENQNTLDHFKEKKLNIDAMLQVACMYRDGLGEEGQNYSKAMEWFKKAAKYNDPIAMDNLAMMYEAGDGVSRNMEVAGNWYKAAKGDPEAFCYLAKFYDSIKDYSLSLFLHNKVVDLHKDEKKIINSMLRIGSLYQLRENGYNYIKAIEWFTHAAEYNNSEAMKNLAMMYEDGRGVNRDAKQAALWYKKAAAAEK